MADENEVVFASPGLVTAAILLLTWSLLTFIARAWIKLRMKFGWSTEDTTLSVAFVYFSSSRYTHPLIGFQSLAISHVVMTCFASKYGYGENIEHLHTIDQTRAKKVNLVAVHSRLVG